MLFRSLALTILAFALPSLPALPQAVPDFRLVDINPRSPRHGQQVSPRDYQLQISVYYFVAAGCSYCRSQYAHLGTVISNVAATLPAMRVEAVAVNRADQAKSNEVAAASFNAIPWVQDDDQQRVWERWGIEWRDILVLDPFNRPLVRDNLTDHDLGNPDNQRSLETLLAQIAAGSDDDGDGLLDAWELGWFGSLGPDPLEDPDGDGFDNRTELAFGSSPVDPDSRPAILPYRTRSGAGDVWGLTFRRFSGAAARLIVETSSTADFISPEPVLPAAPRNLHDGLGGGEARVEIPAAHFPDGRAFFRVRLEEP